jgi:hypothetical protein
MAISALLLVFNLLWMVLQDKAIFYLTCFLLDLVFIYELWQKIQFFSNHHLIIQVPSVFLYEEGYPINCTHSPMELILLAAQLVYQQKDTQAFSKNDLSIFLAGAGIMVDLVIPKISLHHFNCLEYCRITRHQNLRTTMVSFAMFKRFY